MSKKLLAVAAATALALTGLIAPQIAIAATASSAALAASFSDGHTEDGSTSAKAATLDVPDRNEIDDDGSSSHSNDTAGLIEVDGDTGSTVNVTVTGAVRLLRSTDGTDDSSDEIDNTKVGRSVLSYTIDGSDDFYVYTTSTTVGTVVVTITNSSTTYKKTFYIKGVAGEAYYFNGVAGVPATLADDSADVSINATDVFGNKVTGTRADGDVEVLFTSYSDGTSSNDFDWDASEGKYVGEISTSYEEPMIVTISSQVSRVDGFAAPSEAVTYYVNSKGSSTLQGQITALENKLANRVTKKRYNTLAKKWNAAFPAKAVALKK